MIIDVNNTTATKNNDGYPIFSAWTAIEVLSPQTFKNMDELANNNNKILISFSDQVDLPWESGDDHNRRKHFYQIILGTIHYDQAIKALLQRYPENHVERTTRPEYAIIAVALVDHQGKLLKDQGIVISSFAWGLSPALAGDLKALSLWPEAEKILIRDLEQVLRHYDQQGNEKPLTKTIIDNGLTHLITALNLEEYLVNKTISHCVKNYIKIK